jgi:tetratricopeptide (TPR) repeat protein
MLKSEKIRMIARITVLIIAITPLLHQECIAEYANPSTGVETDVSYWLDRGGLYAAYGNFSAAIKAYNKALVLGPNDSSAYFNLSLAFCELGHYEDSLEAIKQAIVREPQNGNYYYGQAWVMVKAGNEAEARAIFHHAADLGDPDAIAYLESQD